MDQLKLSCWQGLDSEISIANNWSCTVGKKKREMTWVWVNCKTRSHNGHSHMATRKTQIDSWISSISARSSATRASKRPPKSKRICSVTSHRTDSIPPNSPWPSPTVTWIMIIEEQMESRLDSPASQHDGEIDWSYNKEIQQLLLLEQLTITRGWKLILSFARSLTQIHKYIPYLPNPNMNAFHTFHYSYSTYKFDTVWYSLILLIEISNGITYSSHVQPIEVSKRIECLASLRAAQLAPEAWGISKKRSPRHFLKAFIISRSAVFQASELATFRSLRLASLWTLASHHVLWMWR